MIPIPITELAIDDMTLGQPEFWTRTDRDACFAKLRSQRPVSFQDEFEYPGLPKGPGFWSVTRWDDVWTVGRTPDLFVSGQGTNIGDLPIDLLEFFGAMINMDAPRHTKLRLLVNKGFTPRMVARVELVKPRLTRNARRTPSWRRLAPNSKAI
jgi:cytochrome P450